MRACLASDKGRAVPGTISVGLATHGDGWRSRDLAELLAAADGALCAAKQQGRNRCALHTAKT